MASPPRSSLFLEPSPWELRRHAQKRRRRRLAACACAVVLLVGVVVAAVVVPGGTAAPGGSEAGPAVAPSRSGRPAVRLPVLPLQPLVVAARRAAAASRVPPLRRTLAARSAADRVAMPLVLRRIGECETGLVAGRPNWRYRSRDFATAFGIHRAAWHDYRAYVRGAPARPEEATPRQQVAVAIAISRYAGGGWSAWGCFRHRAWVRAGLR